MPACTFFGHRDCPESIKPKLRLTLVDLIERLHVHQFYVGCQGAFDALAVSVLQELSEKYPYIHYEIVLEQLPGKCKSFHTLDFSHTVFPEELENVPPRWAIARRNEWMLKHSDYVIAYVSHSWGSAAQIIKKTIHQKKVLLNLAPQPDKAAAHSASDFQGIS